jgi:DNA-binding LytR/AlgR family response regulator
MEAMLERMDDRMYRCHHSLAVNMNLIRSISKANVEMRDGKEIAMCRAAIYRTKHAWKEHILGGQEL